MKALPSDVEPYKRTPEFSEDTIPKGILANHATKQDVWGRICVLEGQLVYEIVEPEAETVLLSPSKDGVVEPAMKHHVRPVGPVRFFVEFLKAPE